MTIEVLEESGLSVDARRLADLSHFLYAQLRIHPQAELCIKVVDEPTIAELNDTYMGKSGPTDVLAFPMDELRPGMMETEPDEGVLGDIMLCPAVAQRQAAEVRTRGDDSHDTAAELDLLTVHGVLHLLGYDHAEPEEHKEMFTLQGELLSAWKQRRTELTS